MTHEHDRSRLQRPCVSVLMAVYNTERYIAEAVESILAQTFADLELLIIDDGSTDRSPEILRRYAARDPRIRLTCRENRGLIPSRNELLRGARGEFVTCHDSDDVAHPERLALQVAYLREHPGAACVGSSYALVDERGRYLTRLDVPCDDATIQDLALAGHTPFPNVAAMFRRETALAVGGYREEIALAEDLDLFLRLGEVGRLAALPGALVKVRLRGTSVSERQQARMLDLARLASDQACDRRGIERRFRASASFRPEPDRDSRHKFSLRYGWWAFNSGGRWTAMHYGWQAIRWVPWRAAGWRLLACALLKPARQVP